MTRRFPFLLATPLLLLAAGGCGTIERGGSEDVAIVVQPPDSRIETSRGDRCVGSCVLSVPRSQGFTVTASRTGYRSATVEVRSVLSTDGMRASAANAAGPLVVGVGVDLYTGAVYDHRPNPVSIQLERLPPGAPLGPPVPPARRLPGAPGV